MASNPMKICSPQLGISPYSNLGGAVYDREILKGLTRLGIDIEIPLPRGELHEDVVGWRVYRTPRHRFYYYEYNLIFLPYLIKLWPKPGFDLLRVHSPYSVGLGALLFKQLTGVPIVAHYHHLEDKRIYHLVNKSTIRLYDWITTDSEFCRKQITSTYEVNEDKIAVIYPGVDAKYQPHPRNEWLRCRLGADDKLVLLYLGVLTPRKNLLFLLDVFAEVLKSVSKTCLIIAGSGTQESELRTYAQRVGLDKHVIFTGYVPEDEKVDYYNLADIFVLPSMLEGFGMVAAEAMACGKPVVASNVSSIPEVVEDEKTGFLADPMHKDDFVEKLLWLMQDRGLRRRIGEAARERVLRNFSWDTAAQKVLEVYQQAIWQR